MIRRTIIILFALFTFVLSYGQQNDHEIALYKYKVDQYTKLKKRGGVMATIGVCTGLMGALLISNADWEKTTDDYGNTQYNTSNPGGLFGVVFICVGAPLSITGLVLNGVGNRKIKYYNQKLENVKLGLYQNGQQKGFTLSMRF